MKNLSGRVASIVGIALVLANASVVRGYPGDVFQNGSPAATPSEAPADATQGTSPYSVGDDGVVKYAIPLPVAPNRQGAVPSLALSYSSRGSIRGDIAAGWSLNIPRIEVDTSQGRLGERRYRSTLSGGRLVRVAEPGGTGENYRGEIDPTYTRYERTRGKWIARATDGRVYYFGETPESRDEPHAAAPDATEGRWFVTRVVDKFGNEIRYTYEKTLGTLWNGAAQDVPVDITLKSVSYGANPRAGLTDHASLFFDHEKRGFDLCPGSNVPIGARFDYRSGFPIYEGARRLDNVRLDVKEGTIWRERRRVTLKYDVDELGCPAGRLHAPLRLLTSIETSGTSPTGAVTTMSPVVFTYGKVERELSVPIPAVPLGAGKAALSTEKAGGWPTINEMLLDVDGDGRVDLATARPLNGQGCQADWSRNLGDGTYGPAQPLGTDVGGGQLGLPTIPWAAGASGNPGPDRDEREGCSLSAQFSRVSNVTEDVCGWPASYQSYRFLDLTGDGRADLVTSIDANVGHYRPALDPRMWPGLPMVCEPHPDTCFDDGEPELCPVIQYGPPPYQLFTESDPGNQSGCPVGQTPSDPDCTFDCDCVDGEPIIGSSEAAPVDNSDEEDEGGGFTWSGPNYLDAGDYYDLGSEGQQSWGNASCQMWPEVQCDRYVLRVHENLGDGRFDEPRIVYSPIPLEADRGTSRLGAGPLAASSSWHGFVDLDGDGYVDAVHMQPFFFGNDAVLTPGSFSVWRGDGTGNFRGHDDGTPYQWSAPIIPSNDESLTQRARVTLTASTNLTAPTAPDAPWDRKSWSRVSLRDINGDSLPDYIDTRYYGTQPPRVRVFYNTGAGFESNATLTAAFPSFQGTVLHSAGAASLTSMDESLQRTLVREEQGALHRGFSRASVRPVDLDADGLIDVVTLPSLSNGTHNPFLTDAKTQPAAFFVNMGDALVPMGSPPKLAAWWPGLSRITLSERAEWRVLTDFVDLDGDGLAEIVNRNPAAAHCTPDPDDGFGVACQFWQGATDALADPDDGQGMRMLRRIDNGRGGSVEFDYAAVRSLTGRAPHPVWVSTRVTESPGLGADLQPAPALVTEHAYETPVYLPDPEGSWGFRGFEQVTTTAPSGARTVSQFAYDLHHAGLVVERRTYEADGRLHRLALMTHTRDDLFGGATWAIHPRSETARTCFRDQDEAMCETSGAIARQVHEWIPFAPAGAVPVVHVVASQWTSDQLTAAFGSKVATYEYGGVSNSTDYRIVRRTERRYTMTPALTLVGTSRAIYDATDRVVLENHELADVNGTWIRKAQTYDLQTGNLITSQRPKHHGTAVVSRNTYDARKLFVVTVTDELGHTVDRSYDLASGQVLVQRGPNSKPCGIGCTIRDGSEMTVDGLGRPLTASVYVDDPQLGYRPELVTRIAYRDAPTPLVGLQLERRINFGSDQWTKAEAFSDGLGRPAVVRAYELDAVRAESRQFYDEEGNLTRLEVPRPDSHDGSRVKHTRMYDSLGRLIGATPPGGAPGQYWTYDARATETGETISSTGDLGRVTRTVTDGYGRRTSVEELMDDGHWAVTSYTYGVNDQVDTVTSADGTVTMMTHDALGQRTSVERGKKTWTFEYDADGAIIAGRSPMPTGALAADYTTTIVRDAIGRPESRITGRRDLSATEIEMYGEGAVTWKYDQGSNGIGRLSTETSAHGSVDYAYEARGLLTSSRHRFSILDGRFEGDRTVRSEYNALGEPLERTFGDGDDLVLPTTAEYGYDARGLLYKVASPQLGTLAQLSRTDAGLVDVLGIDDTVRASLGFDEGGRMTKIDVLARAPGEAALTRRAYQDQHFSETGEIDALTTWLDVEGTRVQHDWSFKYDRRGQLVNADGPLDYRAQFEYSPAGRLLHADVSADPLATGVTTRAVDYQYADRSGVADPDAPVALVDDNGAWMSIDYDVSGNAIKRRRGKGEWDHRYDNLDQQREVVASDGQREVYWYGPSGGRELVAHMSGGEVESVRWNFAGTELRYQPSGKVGETLVFPGAGVRVRDRSHRELMVTDARGSLLAVVDASGEVLAGFSFGPYGERMAELGSQQAGLTQRFNGKDFDRTSALSYYGARYYDTESLTWTQLDPLYLAAPDLAGNPRELSLYGFSLNNPVRFVDPFGMNTDDEMAPVMTGPNGPIGDWSTDEDIEAACASDPGGCETITVESEAPGFTSHAGYFGFDGSVYFREPSGGGGRQTISAWSYNLNKNSGMRSETGEGYDLPSRAGGASFEVAAAAAVVGAALAAIPAVVGGLVTNGARAELADEAVDEVINTLLPGEGNVGTFNDLIKAGAKGDNLTPHHVPSAAHMAQQGIARGDGIAINVEMPVPGTGGRHRSTFTHGNRADVGMSPRDALAAGIRDLRRIYQADGVYSQYVSEQLSKVIDLNFSTFADLFGE